MLEESAKSGWTERLMNGYYSRLEEQQLLKKIRKRRQKWIGHVLRHEGLVKMVIEGRLEGKRGKGRRNGMLDNFGVSFPNLKRWAEDRKKWRREFPC